MKASGEVFGEAVRVNAQLQLGMYFDRFEDEPSIIRCTSEFINEPYWNYSAVPDTSLIDFRALTADAERMASLDREQAFYILNESERTDELETLLDDVWMRLTHRGRSRVDGLRFRSATSESDQAHFLALFDRSYRGVATDADPYGGLPASYTDALRSSLAGRFQLFDVPRRGGQNLIGSVGGRDVAIATIIWRDEVAGLYNVGVPPEHRGHGFGSSISAHACDVAFDAGASEVILQTEPESAVEALYSRLGFSRWFVASVVSSSVGPFRASTGKGGER